MFLSLTPEEVKVLRFALESDLEIVDNALEDEGSAEEWQYDKRILSDILAKMGNNTEGEQL